MKTLADIASKIPVDRTAAIVTSGGVHYETKYIIKLEHNDNPLPMRPVVDGEVDLTGKRRGRVVVIGKAAEGAGWVVRCDCGKYTYRKAKTLRKYENDDDCCGYCNDLRNQRRKDEYQRLGFNRVNEAPIKPWKVKESEKTC